MIPPHSCSDDTLSNLIFVRIIRRCGVHVFFTNLIQIYITDLTISSQREFQPLVMQSDLCFVCISAKSRNIDLFFNYAK